MGRKPTLNKDYLLDVAEEILIEKGASALTIGTVAEAAGISKGGIQSAIGSKEDLITAMLQRWIHEEEIRFNAFGGQDSTKRALAHIESIAEDDTAARKRSASFLAILLQSPAHRRTVREWYHERFNGLAADSEQARLARLAFLAAEGLVFIRYLDLLNVDDSIWSDALDDIKKLAQQDDSGMLEADKKKPPLTEGT